MEKREEKLAEKSNLCEKLERENLMLKERLLEKPNICNANHQIPHTQKH